MQCPFCNNKQTYCKDSRPHKDGRYRRYLCDECGKRFSTIESIVGNKRSAPVKKAVSDTTKKPTKRRNGFVRLVENAIDAFEAVGELPSGNTASPDESIKAIAASTSTKQLVEVSYTDEGVESRRIDKDEFFKQIKAAQDKRHKEKC